MTPSEKFNALLAPTQLVAILRGLTPAEAPEVGRTLFDAGFRLIEVPLNSPQPLDSIARLSADLPQALVGAGTVLTVQQVREVEAAGGRLIVAPNFDADVVREAVRRGLACVPGVGTVSEAFAALAAGATALKLFPAEMIPPAAVKAMLAVLPAGTALLPVGGITASNMAAYTTAGAAGFGIGSALYKPGKAIAALAESARDFLAARAGTIRA